MLGLPWILFASPALNCFIRDGSSGVDRPDEAREGSEMETAAQVRKFQDTVTNTRMLS